MSGVIGKDRHTQGEGHVNTEAEMGVMCLEAKEPQGLCGQGPEGRKKQERK